MSYQSNHSHSSGDDAPHELEDDYSIETPEQQSMFNSTPMPQIQTPSISQAPVHPFSNDQFRTFDQVQAQILAQTQTHTLPQGQIRTSLQWEQIPSSNVSRHVNPAKIMKSNHSASHLQDATYRRALGSFNTGIQTHANIGVQPRFATSVQSRPSHQPSQIYQAGHFLGIQYPQNIDDLGLGEMRRSMSDPQTPEDHREQDALFQNPQLPRRSTVGNPPTGHPTASEYFQPQPHAQATYADNMTTQAAPSQQPQTPRNRPILPLPKKKDRSSESATDSTRARRARNEIEAMKREAEGVSGWGWRWREEGEAGPIFGETRETLPLFNENGQRVAAELHGSFEVSRLHAGKISDDGGPLVHELQKRNIFLIKNMSYTLDGTNDANFLAIRIGNTQRRINRMFVKLVGQKSYGDSEDNTLTPLETRGKARQYKPARIVEIFEEMRYEKSDNGFTCHNISRYGDVDDLPSVHSESHLEFKHATSGNKTTGYWRVESQSYYRLALQMWAYTGNPNTSLDEIKDSRNLIKVAESRTNLLIVRGRPPGGRELAAEKSSKPRSTKRKSRQKAATTTRTRRQKREETPDDEEDEAEWVNDSRKSRISRGPGMQNSRTDVAQNPSQSEEEDQSPKRYGVRKISKRTYEEMASDSNEQNTSTGVQQAESPDESEFQASSPSFDGSENTRKNPQGQERQHALTQNVARETGNENQESAGSHAFQVGQHDLLFQNMGPPPIPFDDQNLEWTNEVANASEVQIEEFNWDEFEPYLDTENGSPSLEQPDPPAYTPSAYPESATQPQGVSTLRQNVATQPSWMPYKGKGRAVIEAQRRLQIQPPQMMPGAPMYFNSDSDQSRPVSEGDASSPASKRVKTEPLQQDVWLGAADGSVDFDDF